MARIMTVAAALAILVALGGCVPYFKVGVSGPLEAPVASIKAAGPFGRAICLTAFSVSEYDSRAVGRELWSIGVKTDGVNPPRCIELDSLTYGQVPEGFQVLVPAEPLKADVPYAATGVALFGDGGPHAHGVATVVFSEGRWRSSFGLPGRRWVRPSPEAVD